MGTRPRFMLVPSHRRFIYWLCMYHRHVLNLLDDASIGPAISPIRPVPGRGERGNTKEPLSETYLAVRLSHR